MKTLFVTGTDTGVGKTLVSCALITYWISLGYKVSGFKPVASGSQWINGKLKNDDALQLQKASNTSAQYDSINPYALEVATAPHIAAELQHKLIDLRELDKAFEKLSGVSERIVVEGAGGWQVPLNEQASFADWVAAKQWPVLLVVNIKLGCINHARLTMLDIKRCGNPLVGWIANIQSTEVEYAAQMIQSIAAFTSAPLLGTIPPLDSGNNSNLFQFFDFSLL